MGQDCLDNLKEMIETNQFVMNLPEHAELYEVDLQPGDIIIAATDGLFDNLFIHEIKSIVQECIKSDAEGLRLIQNIAKRLVRDADLKIISPKCKTPFGNKLRKLRKHSSEMCCRGKDDDVTVVVCTYDYL